MKCPHCINYYEKGNSKKKTTSGKDWIHSLNRIKSRPDLPISLQGGEPTLHKDFYEIVNGIKRDLHIDLLTNMQFDPYEFMKHIPSARIKREAPYASIRASYHPGITRTDEFFEKVLLMQKNGYSIGVWGLLHPAHEKEVLEAQKKGLEMGIDFRTKEFLGRWNGKLYGTYKYPDAVALKDSSSCLCRTTELLLGPGLDIFRCHHDLYEGLEPIGNLLDTNFKIDYSFRECNSFGFCNPCDIKVKTNRFQVFGHTSVEIQHGDKTSFFQEKL